MGTVELADDADELDLGGAPRTPMSTRTRRLLAAGAGVVAVAAVTVFVLVRPDAATPSAAPSTTATPFVESSAGFAAGPVLTKVDGRDALQAPGLPGRGSTFAPIVLDPAPAAVAVLAKALPGLRDVRGGQVTDDDTKFGLYLSGTYDDPNGSDVAFSLYTVRAPGTTFGTDQYVSRTRFDLAYTVRTDVSVFTGTGWWVHVVTLGPDDPQSQARGEIDRVLPLAQDPVLSP